MQHRYTDPDADQRFALGKEGRFMAVIIRGKGAGRLAVKIGWILTQGLAKSNSHCHTGVGWIRLSGLGVSLCGRTAIYPRGAAGAEARTELANRSCFS